MHYIGYPCAEQGCQIFLRWEGWPEASFEQSEFAPRGEVSPGGELGPQGECSALCSPPGVNTVYC
jgi:hypothetical protein